ncbi:hypothetical protein TNCT_148231 [Trichonephila clavata]|uniref:Uncharacterized protein n=1 Tax=Trichonephila clavata TaxID=2740835 RepID=A0A8X6GE07_TRICU|nr:hypothetical protein TNCT_148231 [Trichonephila clavata]
MPPYPRAAPSTLISSSNVPLENTCTDAPGNTTNFSKTLVRETMWSTTYGSSTACFFFMALLVGGLSPEFFFGDVEKKNFSLGFHHYRMGIRRFSAGQTPDGCKCHRDPVLPDEIICVCKGPGVKDLQTNLTRGVTRL